MLDVAYTTRCWMKVYKSYVTRKSNNWKSSLLMEVHCVSNKFTPMDFHDNSVKWKPI